MNALKPRSVTRGPIHQLSVRNVFAKPFSCPPIGAFSFKTGSRVAIRILRSVPIGSARGRAPYSFGVDLKRIYGGDDGAVDREVKACAT